jgi:glycosyltransferase involved in cell wall biosynthesis
MRVAMIGLRGVPATSGGIERSVEDLGAALAARGHEVTVYCRSNYVDWPHETYEGMRLRVLPTISTKHLDAIAHTALATAHALRGFDVLHYHAIGPGLLTTVSRPLSRSAIVQTIHGVDWQRAKWGGFARLVLRLGELASTRLAHELIVPSQALSSHYASVHGRESTVIPNTFHAIPCRSAVTIGARFGLEARRYVLFVGRLTPEKQVHTLLRAYRRVVGDNKLVIVGGSSFTDSYVAELEALAQADDRVVMTGELHGPVLEELYSNAAAFVSPSALESFNITLVEAISAGLPIVASSIEPHVELLSPLDGAARFHAVGDEEGLARAIEEFAADPEGPRGAVARYAAELVEAFSAERVAEQTEAIYERALAQRRPTAPRLSSRTATTPNRTRRSRRTL